MDELKCPYCDRICTSKSGLTLHIKNCMKKTEKEENCIEPDPEPEPESEPTIEESEEDKSDPDDQLNRRLIEAIQKRQFSAEEIKEITEILQIKLTDPNAKSAVYALDNGETIRLTGKYIRIANRGLVLCRHLDMPEKLDTDECPVCKQRKRIKIGSEPNGKEFLVHFFCYECKQYTSQTKQVKIAP